MTTQTFERFVVANDDSKCLNKQPLAIKQRVFLMNNNISVVAAALKIFRYPFVFIGCIH